MIKPICHRCEKELGTYGAILFSPPKGTIFNTERCDKIHICVDCYYLMLDWIRDSWTNEK